MGKQRAADPTRWLPVGTGVVDLWTGSVDTPRGSHRLTETEQKLLTYFNDHRGRIVPRDELLVHVWGYAPGVRSRTTDTTIQRLRRKIERDPRCPEVLQTVRGQGFRWVPPIRPDRGPSDRPCPIPRLESIVGRQPQLDRLQELIDGRRIVTLVGPVGVGKTFLLRRLLTQLDDAGQIAVAFVGVEGIAPRNLLLEAMVQALRVARPFDDAEGASTTHLAGAGPILVGVDSAEDLDTDALRMLSGWVRTLPGLTLVLTSRRRLGLEGEACLEVGPLPLVDAVALLRQHLDDLGQESADGALIAAAEALEGLPLALTLAAASLELVSPDQLDLGSPLLDEPRPDVPRRHHSLKAAYTASVARLPPEARIALAGLSLFPGPFGPQDAQAVAPGATLRVIRTLRRHSLLRTLGDRLQLHGVIRAWAAAEASTEADRLRFVDWVIAATRGCTPDRLSELGLDLRRALDWADPPRILPLARAMQRLLYLRGPTGELFDRMAPLLGRLVGTPHHAHFAAGLIGILSDRGDHGAAHDLLVSSLREAEGMSNTAGELRLRRAGLWLLVHRGHLEQARDEARRLLPRAEAHGDPRLTASILGMLGTILARLDDPGFVGVYRRAIAMAPGQRMTLLHNLGTAWVGIGVFDEAIAAITQAIEEGRQRNDLHTSLAWCNLARVQAEVGDADAAMASLGQATSTLEGLRDVTLLQRVRMFGALVQARLGHRDRAEATLRRLVEGPVGDPRVAVRTRIYLALLSDDSAVLPQPPLSPLDEGYRAAASAILRRQPLPDDTPIWMRYELASVSPPTSRCGPAPPRSMSRRWRTRTADPGCRCRGLRAPPRRCPRTPTGSASDDRRGQSPNRRTDWAEASRRSGSQRSRMAWNSTCRGYIRRKASAVVKASFAR